MSDPWANAKTKTTSFSLYPGDQELLDWLVAFFGSNQSDVMRSAIRHFAAHLQATQGKKGA
jgi:hypothetical protein